MVSFQSVKTCDSSNIFEIDISKSNQCLIRSMVRKMSDQTIKIPGLVPRSRIASFLNET